MNTPRRLPGTHLMLTQPLTAAPSYAFAADVRAGLTKSPQKELLSKYLYDDVGSALFEVIGLLPEYGLTRADERLLRRYASEIVSRLPRPVIVAELGSGSGKKTRAILEALCQRQNTPYFPIEISRKALAMVKRELGDIDCVSIVGFEREYLDGLVEVASRRKPFQHLMVLFLGSTIGNFDPPAGQAFLRNVREALHPGDSLLLGTDLEKPVGQMLAAYVDSLGVTAAFNLNLLTRINRELRGDFDLRHFDHLAKYNGESRSIEMHIRSLRQQQVTLPAADLSVGLAEGETIWTETSHKYSLAELSALASDTGFRMADQWIDREWPFAESLLIAE